jgi:hypothetical protein
MNDYSDLDEYYPGSKVKRRDKHEPVPDITEPLELGPPVVLLVRGKLHEFFLIGAFAAALGRRPVTIRTWEQNGTLPVARFFTPGIDGDTRGKRRLYTREQIEGIVKIAHEEGVLDILTKKPIKHTKFTERAVDLYENLEV